MKHEKRDRFLKQPTYKGGMQALKDFIIAELRYPELAMQNKTEGTVSLRFDIDHKGNVDNVQLLSSIGHGCDEEAVRLVMMLKFMTHTVKGMRVTYHKSLNIHFALVANQVAVAEQIEPAPTVLPMSPTPKINYTVTPKVKPAVSDVAKIPASTYKIVYTIK